MSGKITVEDGYAVIRVPMAEVHSLRVALSECPCKSTKSIGTMNIRKRLLTGLARIVEGGK